MMPDYSNLPPPPVPPDADLRFWRGMLIDPEFILNGNRYSRPSVAYLAILVMLTSWRNIPAGSLPEDARATWYKVQQQGISWRAFDRDKSEATRDWYRCNDGRWYHDYVAAEVNRCLNRQRPTSRSPSARSSAEPLSANGRPFPPAKHDTLPRVGQPRDFHPHDPAHDDYDHALSQPRKPFVWGPYSSVDDGTPGPFEGPDVDPDDPSKDVF